MQGHNWDASDASTIESDGTSHHCSFISTLDGLGLTLASCGDGLGISVLAFAPLRSGALGPAMHDGDQLVPGDVIVCVNGLPATNTLLEGIGPLALEFRRDNVAKTSSAAKGGRPANLKPKHKRAAPSSAPSTLGKKPQYARASSLPMKSRKTPEATVEGEVSLADQVKRSREELRAAFKDGKLTGDAKSDRDQKLATSTYLD